MLFIWPDAMGSLRYSTVPRLFGLARVLLHIASKSPEESAQCKENSAMMKCSSFSPAGTVMFEYGMRLGREVRTLRGLQKQGNCYLAAINCLQLIRPEYAWIVQPASGAVV